MVRGAEYVTGGVGCDSAAEPDPHEAEVKASEVTERSLVVCPRRGDVILVYADVKGVDARVRYADLVEELLTQVG